MTSIATFSTDKVFTIKVVSNRTGVKSVTLRAWERRYELLTPKRLENGYRLYSEQDVQILLWVMDKLDGGESISMVAEQLNMLRAEGKWPDAVSMPMTIKPKEVSPLPARHFAEMLFGSLISNQEEKAGRVMNEVERYFEINTIFEEVVFPALALVGEAWYRGDIRIATEHFASNFIKGRMMRIFQSIPVRRENVSILCGTGEEEDHELPALMFAVLLRQEGYGVEYLGPDLPVHDLVEYAETVKPKMVCLSLSSSASANYLSGLAEKLAQLPSHPQLVYGGQYFMKDIEAREALGGIYLGDTLSAGINKIKQILPIG